MYLKDFIDVQDSIYCPILVFNLETQKGVFLPDFKPYDENYEEYIKYIKAHENYEVRNISIITKDNLFGISLSLSYNS